MNILGPSLPTKAAIPICIWRASRTQQRKASGIAKTVPSRAFWGPLRRQSCPATVGAFRAPQSRRQFHASPSHSATKNPYSVLGVDKSASTAEIKKAYYTLAKKYHPDTNKDANAKDRFSEAQAAYEVLSDPKKKEAWDQYGAAAFDGNGGFDPSAGAAGGDPFAGFSGFSQGGGFGADINLHDIFGAFTGGGGRRGRSKNSPFQEEILVGENIEVQATVSFMDAAKGTSKVISITPLTPCNTCSGSGLKKGIKRSECKQCHGSGTRVIYMTGGFQMATTCEACGGQGVSVPRGGECNSCSGNGVIRDRRSVTLDIPGGIEDGMRLRVSGEGDAPPTGGASNPKQRTLRGDLFVSIRVTPDAKFRRNGSDVLYTASIPLTTAVLGGEVKVPTLDGEVKVKVGTGTASGDSITLSGLGMRRLGGRKGMQGDMKVEFKVAMPKYLSANQRTIVEMLAEEMGDVTAKRIMNIPRNNGTSPAPPPSSSTEASQKSEGFLKSALHRFMDNVTHAKASGASEDSSVNKAEEEPKKKASGSGS
ncbi:MAG: hypothetical protein M1829_002031 [Trizodia sp. TS-e1964]|nr:MAG: hypothetical protein M1829_002031 [Trizodia sp. TS-e1964]